MHDSIRIWQLVERAIDSGLSPENVCAQDPNLLAEVRRRLVRSRNLQSQLDAMFPPAAPETRDTNSVSEQQAELPPITGYELQIELGRGGVGVVYRALDLRLNRLVALKMLLAGAHASALDRARFVREARAVAALCNANIVQIHDIGESEGTPFFTMELCSGGTLAGQLAGTPQPVFDAAERVAILADAVSTAHGAGIVHRDLKPANILLSADGTPKISDFGLARYMDLGDALTISGVRVGTPSYMAPEQASGRSAAIGPAADIYALGAILYEMLTGRPPFRGESPADTERQLLCDDPIPPGRLNPRVPRDLQTVCLKCLAKQPSQRYSTVAALADDLRRFGRGEPVVARPTGRLARTGKWIRRHPGAAAAVFATTVMIVASLSGLLWLWLSRAATIAAVNQDLHDAALCQQRFDWTAADENLKRAAIRLGSHGPAESRAGVAAARRDLDLALRLDTVRLAAVGTGGRRNDALSDKGYTAAFHEGGIGDPTDDPTVVAERIRRSSVHDALVAALDD